MIEINRINTPDDLNGQDALNGADLLMMSALDGTLDAEGQRRLDAYLRANPDEREAFAQMMALETAIAADKQTILRPPKHFTQNVLAAVRHTAIAAPAPVQTTVAMTPFTRRQVIWALVVSSILAVTVFAVIGGVAYTLSGNLNWNSLGRAAYAVGTDTVRLFVALGRSLIAHPLTWVVLAAGIGACATWFTLIARAWRPIRQLA